MRRAAAVWGGALLLTSAAMAQTTSTQQNPVHTFATPGTYQVTLEACNWGGCTTVTRTVTVLDPAPSIVSAVVGAATAEVGQLVSFSGSGKGQPPLAYTWRVFLGATLVREVSGAQAWLDTAGLEPGVYTVLLRITNGTGQAESLPAVLTLVPATAADFFTVTPCRLLDTRIGSPLVSRTTRLLNVAGSCGIPAEARALAVNVTAVIGSSPGNLVVFPGNYPAPATNTVSYKAGAVVANNAILPLSTDGLGNLSILALMQDDGSSVHVLVDVVGYFAAPVGGISD
ncbi:MAG: PKD domain-containing protein [Thermoanaerobaculia bacterium]